MTNNIEKLIANLQGKDADAQAKAIANFMQRSNRKKTIEDERKETRDKIFKDCRRLSKAQQESLIYSYLAENPNWMTNWLHKKHEELYSTKE